eukprot:tig00020603_g11830.t1
MTRRTDLLERVSLQAAEQPRQRQIEFRLCGASAIRARDEVLPPSRMLKLATARSPNLAASVGSSHARVGLPEVSDVSSSVSQRRSWRRASLRRHPTDFKSQLACPPRPADPSRPFGSLRLVLPDDGVIARPGSFLQIRWTTRGMQNQDRFFFALVRDSAIPETLAAGPPDGLLLARPLVARIGVEWNYGKLNWWIPASILPGSYRVWGTPSSFNSAAASGSARSSRPAAPLERPGLRLLRPAPGLRGARARRPRPSPPPDARPTPLRCAALRRRRTAAGPGAAGPDGEGAGGEDVCVARGGAGGEEAELAEASPAPPQLRRRGRGRGGRSGRRRGQTAVSRRAAAAAPFTARASSGRRLVVSSLSESRSQS